MSSSACPRKEGESTLTGSQHRQIDEAQRPDLPVEECLPKMAYLEVFLFSDGRVVVFCHKISEGRDAEKHDHTLSVNDIGAFFRSKVCSCFGKIEKHYIAL